MTVVHGKLEQLNTSIADGRLDLFIGSASFESRCHSIPSHIEVSRIGKAIIGRNLTYRDAVQTNFDLFRERFKERLVELPLFADDPVQSADNIAQCVGDALASAPRRIVVDITTFTRESLFMLLRFLHDNLRSEHRTALVYAHAKDYSVGDSFDKKWLSKGIRDVRSVLGFPGDMVPSRPTHMIVMVGFEDERALELIRECEPSFVSLGVGDASEEGTRPHQVTNLHRFARLKSILSNVEEFTFQAYDPQGTRDALRKQITRRQNCNVVIAPMNTKISSVGATLLACEDESIQLCYAPANIYNVERYSLPDDDYYLFDLPGLSR